MREYMSKNIQVYHCGASSKDARKKITTITQIKDTSNHKGMITKLLTNSPLILC